MKNKVKTAEKIAELCKEFIKEAKKIAGVKKTGNIKKPCGLLIFIFGEIGSAVIRAGKIDSLEILNFLMVHGEGVMITPVTTIPQSLEPKSTYTN